MSLLMEALRKAEAAKRAGQQGAASEDAPAEPAAAQRNESAVPDVFKFTTSEDLMALSSRAGEIADIPDSYARQPEPVPVSTTTDDVLDDYLSTQQEPEHDELPTNQAAARERVKVQQQRERQAAASMFDAKAPARTETAARQRRMQVLAGSLIVASIGIAGGWLYLASTNSGSGITVNPALTSNAQNRGFLGETPTEQTAAPVGNATGAVATAAPAPATVTTVIVATAEPAINPGTAQPAAASAPPAQPGTTAADSAEPALAVTDPQLAGPVEQDPQDTPAIADAAVVAEQPASAVVAPPLAAQQQTADIPTPAVPAVNLQISRSTTASTIQPALQSAYENLMQGDLEGANQLYQEVLSQSANNRDALLGLAAVQSQLGNQNGARTTYGRLLQLNPQDALARTGLLQTLAGIDPTSHEQDLLALHQRFPQLAPLNYALGNLYAGSGRWHQAQEAYFDALLQARREGNTSPDYAFNLAVSLEQIGQPAAALQYYKEAETLASTSRPGFDPMLLRQRLSVLEQQP